jgi:hypothetical protein
MLWFFISIAVIATLVDIVLWLRFLRPTPVVWERRTKLIAAILGLVPPLIFLVVIGQFVGIVS